MKWKIVALLASLLVLPAMAADYKTIDWDVLIPEGEKLLPPPQVNHEDPMSVPQPVGGVNKKLDNQEVRIPGFVVPLEGDAKTITAFLLVPYFGACIHSPPPPSNQIIHVRPREAAKGVKSMDAVWISGTLKTLRSDTFMGASSYRLEAVAIEIYTEKK